MPDNLRNDWGAQTLDVEQLNRRYRNAVVSGCAVSDGAGALEIDVAGGEAIVAGTRYSVSATTLTLATADPENPRKDVIYVDSAGAPAVAKGDPEPARPDDESRRDTYTPAPPDLSATDACVLAEVWVPAGASDTDSADISDRRLFADVVAGSGDFNSINAESANHQSVDTEELNNRTITVQPGESIQTAVNDAESLFGVGYVHLPADRTFTESGIEVPSGVRVIGPGDAAVGRNDTPSATVQPAADESVFILKDGRPFIGNIHIDVTNIGGYSSEAILLSDQYDHARGWYLYDNIHATGSRSSTNGDAVIRRRSANGNGIAWANGGRVDMEGFEYGVRDETVADVDFVNANRHDFIAFGGQRVVISQSKGAANSEISGNEYHVGGNGSPNVDSVAVLEGKSTLETWVFDRLNFNTSDVVIINTAGTQLQAHIALTNAEITVNDSPNHIYLTNGSNKFEVGLFGFAHGYVTDLSGLTGDWDGEIRRDDGTNTSGFGVFCSWDATNTQWVPMDGGAAFT